VIAWFLKVCCFQTYSNLCRCAAGCEVTRLHRSAVGAVEIGNLEVGGVRRLEGPELAALQEAVSAAKVAAAGVGDAKRRVEAAPGGWGARIAAEAEVDER
jgi:hypothetical protein